MPEISILSLSYGDRGGIITLKDTILIQYGFEHMNDNNEYKPGQQGEIHNHTFPTSFYCAPFMFLQPIFYYPYNSGTVYYDDENNKIEWTDDASLYDPSNGNPYNPYIDKTIYTDSFYNAYTVLCTKSQYILMRTGGAIEFKENGNICEYLAIGPIKSI